METTGKEVENKISEGSATILLPKGEVFYNPVQQFNRDLSIAVISCYKEKFCPKGGLTILEALSATGLRSIRYLKELTGVEKIYANDLDPVAVELIERNFALNFDSTTSANKFEVLQGDANTTMHLLRSRGIAPNVIDLDPYGSVAPFIDSAIQTIAKNGLLCVTSTDMAVLCSSYPETCFAKYSGTTIKGEVCHEAAIRLVLQALELSANRYQRHIVPLMSCSIDFYVRIFVLVIESAQDVKNACSNRGLVFRCVSCKNMQLYPLLVKQTSKIVKFVKNTAPFPNACSICSARVEINGPLWIDRIHDQEFARAVRESVLKTNTFPSFGTKPRIVGLSSLISEELDDPLYYSITEISSFLKTPVIPFWKLWSSILNAGFKASRSHCNPSAVKTDAPLEFLLYSLIKSTDESFGVRDGRLLESITNKCVSEGLNVEHPLCESESKKNKFKRFPPNPTKNWGPMARAKAAKKTT